METAIQVVCNKVIAKLPLGIDMLTVLSKDAFDSCSLATRNE